MTRRRHHLHSRQRRILYSCGLVGGVMAAGTAGMHLIDGMAWIDAFYFMSMIATAQGPTVIPHTAAGKLFAAFMSFVSVGTVVTALGFLFGPLLGRLWHIGRVKYEEETNPLDGRE